MEVYSCRGLKRLTVKPFDDPCHNNASYNRSQNVEQKVLHRRHLLVLKLGGLPRQDAIEIFRHLQGFFAEYRQAMSKK